MIMSEAFLVDVSICVRWIIFHASVVVCRLFSKLTFKKNYFRNTIRLSNCLDPHQDWHSVGPSLGPNHADDRSGN